MVKQRVI